MLLKTSKGKIVTYLLICVFVLLPECLCTFQCFLCFQCFWCVQNLFVKKKEFKTALITSFILLLVFPDSLHNFRVSLYNTQLRLLHCLYFRGVLFAGTLIRLTTNQLFIFTIKLSCFITFLRYRRKVTSGDTKMVLIHRVRILVCQGLSKFRFRCWVSLRKLIDWFLSSVKSSENVWLSDGFRGNDG